MQLPDYPDVHSEAFLRSLMTRQLRLSVACAACFLFALLGLPLLNFFWPEFMAQRIGGFPLSWLLLGLGFFPAVWLISWVFIRRSIRLEEQEVRESVRGDGGASAKARVSNVDPGAK
jgi:uncharacterized membrane protein (DUF485 family)